MSQHETPRASGSFLGQGWAFPPSFIKGSGGATMVSGIDDIEQSLSILLRTHVGERLMRPDFGCDLHHLIFEPIDRALVAYLEDRVREAILYHEPRIDLLSLEARAKEDGVNSGATILLELTYEVRTTNSRHNFVLPFHQLEATLLPR